MEIHETPLPGVGMRYDFTTAERRQIGVVVHNTGHRELVTYDRQDPDSCREIIGLNDDEADALAEVLGGSRISGPLDDLQHRIDGLAIDWHRLGDDSQYVNRPLGDTQARSRTGVSIVAVMRDDEATAAPKPDFMFAARDVLVMVGTPAGVSELRTILNS